jgi:Glycosyltransferase sugar-binding region containing DXD motif
MIQKAHFYWGNTTLPWLQSLSILTFRKLHPDWEVNVYTSATPCVYDSVHDYWNTIEDCNIYTIDVRDITGASLNGYPDNNPWHHTAWSDALRNYLLLTRGGVWSDVDVLWYARADGSSLDGPGVRMLWTFGVSNGLIAAGSIGLDAFERLCKRQRFSSPAHQVPGGQSPFGPEMWEDEFGNPYGVPDFHQLHGHQFHEPPYSRAMHYRAARIQWVSITSANWREKCSEFPDVIRGIERALEVLA